LALVSREAGAAMFDLGLEEGWIAPMEIRLEISCDNPDWIGGRPWDSGSERLGSHAERVESTRKAIEQSCLEEGEKNRLLAKLEPEGARLWSMGKSRTSILPGKAMASPMEVMLVFAQSGVGEAELERRARALSKRGWALGSALEKEGAWGDMCRKAAKDLKNAKWVERALEREQIEASSRPGIESAKGPRL
jgi:hypothetical protein